MTQTELQHPSEAAGKAIYTAKPHTIGGRKNAGPRSSDGRLDFLSLSGSSRLGTNPKRLFAAGRSACLEAVIAVVARQREIKLPADMAIDAEGDLHLDNGEFFVSARFDISVPRMERSFAQGLVDVAKGICPCATATSGKIAVAYSVV